MAELDLERVQRCAGRALRYAEAAFPDGIREPDHERRSAYNLIVYEVPALIAEVQRLRIRCAGADAAFAARVAPLPDAPGEGS